MDWPAPISNAGAFSLPLNGHRPTSTCLAFAAAQPNLHWPAAAVIQMQDKKRRTRGMWMSFNIAVTERQLVAAGILGENVIIPEGITKSVRGFWAVNGITAFVCVLVFYGVHDQPSTRCHSRRLVLLPCQCATWGDMGDSTIH